ncbi:MAG: hypothetical protein ACOZQL_05050 [Myxococcota bacterium]
MRILLGGVVGLFLVACATTQSAGPAPAAPPKESAPPPAPVVKEKTPEERKAELMAAFARESTPQAEQTFSVGEQRVTVESATPVAPKRNEGSSVQVELGLGASQPVTCFVYERGLDVGTLATRMAKSLTGDTSLSSVRVSDITVVEKSPATFLELGYLAGKPGAQVLGQLKLMFYSSDESPLMCLHDEPGYVQSFKRITSTFAAAMARALTSPEVKYDWRSVSVMRVKGAPIGFERTAWMTRSDGDRVSMSVTAMLVPRSATEFLSTDGVTVTKFAKKDGRVIEKTEVSLNGGELERKLTLTRTKKGYHYEGTAQGKELAGDLVPTDAKGLLSDLLVAQKAKALTAAKPSFTYEEYSPGANPAALTKTVVTRDASVPRGVIIEAGPMKMNTVLDEAGMPQRLTLNAGPVVMELDRVFSEGKVE